MIISRAPYRISFFGGGTDYPDWYNNNGGNVLSTTINKYSYITCRFLPQFFEYKYRIRYYKREEVISIEEIQHPVIRECIKFMNINKGLDIVHHGDLPAQSGIGSSSSFTVGLLHALYALKGKMPTKRQLCIDALQVEQKILKESVGSQDQIASAFGGFNMIEFGGKEEFRVQPIIIKQERLEKLEQSLVLIFTGIVRSAADFAKEQINNIDINANNLKAAQDSVHKALEILNGEGNIDEIGHLLRKQWEIKKSFGHGITNSNLDKIYNAGMSAGAIGGKLLGAGGGGFMLFYVDNKIKNKFLESMKSFVTFLLILIKLVAKSSTTHMSSIEYNINEAVILCGGLGTRLRSIVFQNPKPLAPIGEKFFLDLLVESLIEQKIKKIIFAVGYLSEKIIDRYKDLKGIEICFSEESEPLGTGGAVKHAVQYVKENFFIVINGDSYLNISYMDIIDKIKKEKGKSLIVLNKSIDKRNDVNILELKNGLITSILNSDNNGNKGVERYVNCGIYIFETKYFINEEKNKFSLENYLLINLIKNSNLIPYITNFKLYDIGTPERYSNFLEMFNKNDHLFK